MRLFVAIYPTRPVADALLEAASGLTLPACRWTPVERVHLTLQFIGERHPRDLEQTRESVRRSAAGLRPFPLEPTRLVSMPTPPPARLVAAETTAHPVLNELKLRLVTRLARARSRKPFTPHLTLARFRAPSRDLEVDQPLPDPASLRFDVECIHLMQSTLDPEGAIHEIVETVELGAEEGRVV